MVPIYFILPPDSAECKVFKHFSHQVQRLKVHTQTDFVRKFIKEYFTPNVNKF